MQNKTYWIIALAIIILSNSCGNSTKEKIQENSKEIKIEYAKGRKVRKAQKKLDELFIDMKKYHDFNGSVLIAKNQKIIYKKHFGYASFRPKIEIDSSNTFQLASLSKQFTAVAIVLLQQEGKLQFDDSVVYYFPDFPYAKATIRQLLNHTAGLPKYFWLAEHRWKNDKPPTNMQMMDLMEDSVVMQFFGAGRKYAYSNTAYMVLAAIVEEITGDSFAEYVQENIFEPLQMKNSYIYKYSFDKMRKGQLNGCRRSRGRHVKIAGTVNDAIVGDKNIYSNVDDLYRWIYALNNGIIVSDTNLKQMYSKGKTLSGNEIPYGFGFHIEEENGKQKIFHNGKWNGSRNTITQFPQDGIVIIILEHSGFQGLGELIRRSYSIANY